MESRHSPEADFTRCDWVLVLLKVLFVAFFLEIK